MSSAERRSGGRETDSPNGHPSDEVLDALREGESSELGETFGVAERLREVAPKVSGMTRVAGSFKKGDASKILNAAVAQAEQLTFRGGTINFTTAVEVPASVDSFVESSSFPGRKVLVRIPRGDRDQHVEMRLAPHHFAQQADILLRRLKNVVVPQPLWVGTSRDGDRAEIWQFFDGQEADNAWTSPPEEARDMIADVVVALARRDPFLIRTFGPANEPRTCGEAHAEMLTYFRHEIEHPHWDIFGSALEAINARPTRLGTSYGGYSHPAPDLPTRLVHCDLKPSNVLVAGTGDAEQLSMGIVDVDTGMLGDPAFDLARMILTWRMDENQADRLIGRVEQGLGQQPQKRTLLSEEEPPRMEEGLRERVGIYRKLLAYRSMLLLCSMIAETVEHAPKDDPARTARIMEEMAAATDSRLQIYKAELGTDIIPGGEFVDQVLRCAEASKKGPKSHPRGPVRPRIE